MTKTQLARRKRLMPGGVPRYVRCYDNGGEYADRYTVCFTGRSATERSDAGRCYPYRAMSASPFHPQGIGLSGSTWWQPCDTMREKPGWHWPPAIGRRCHLGVRIHFKDLPADCRKLVIQDYKAIWKL